MPTFLRQACILALLCTALGCEQEEGVAVARKSSPLDVVRATVQAKFSSEDVEGPKLSEILRRASAAVQSIEGNYEKLELLAAVAVVQAKAGNHTSSTEAFRAAFELADTFDDPLDKAGALADIAQQQAEAGDFKSALATAALLRTMKLPELSLEPEFTYALIAICQAEQGHFDGANRTLEWVHDGSWESGVLVQIGTFQWSRGDRDGANETFQRATVAARRIKSHYLRTSALADVAEAHATTGDLESANELIDEALRSAKNEPITGIRQPALESVAGAQAACGDVDGIFRTVAALKLVGSARNLKAAVWAAKRGDFETVINSMTSSRLGVSEPIILGHIANAYSNSGDFESAKKIASTISERDWRSITLCEIASEQIAIGRFTEAAETCAAIDENLYGARTLSEIAAAQMEAGNVELALTLFDQSRDAGMNAVAEDSYNAVILREIAASEAESGRVHASFVWATQQRSALARANALLGVAEGLQKRFQDVREATTIESLQGSLSANRLRRQLLSPLGVPHFSSNRHKLRSVVCGIARM